MPGACAFNMCPNIPYCLFASSYTTHNHEYSTFICVKNCSYQSKYNMVYGSASLGTLSYIDFLLSVAVVCTTCAAF